MYTYHPTVVRKAAPVTKSDSTVLENCDALYVGGTGDLVVEIGGVDVTIKAAAVGYHPISVSKVKSATTATDILALTL